MADELAGPWNTLRVTSSSICDTLTGDIDTQASENIEYLGKFRKALYID